MSTRTSPGFRPLRDGGSGLAQFGRDRDGASFVELALVLPLFILVVLGGVAIYDAMLAYRRTQDIATTVGSTLARFKVVSNDDMVGSLILSSAYMFPFPTRDYTILVAAFTIDSSGNPVLEWCERWSMESGGDCSGTSTISGWNWETGTLSNLTIPSHLRIPDSGLVVAKVTNDWKSPFGVFLSDGLNMEETFYYVPQADINLKPPERDRDAAVTVSGGLKDHLVR